MRVRRSRNPEEAGASMVETAIAFPLAVFLVIALIDGAILFSGYLSAGYASRAGARAASMAGSDALADYDVLKAVQKSTPAINDDQIERIVVYKATSFKDSVPPDCMNAGHVGVAQICNVYLPSDFSVAEANYSESSGWNKDKYWPGWLRESGKTTGPDYVGVAVIVKSNAPFGLIGGATQQFNRPVVLRIEAKHS